MTIYRKRFGALLMASAAITVLSVAAPAHAAAPSNDAVNQRLEQLEQEIQDLDGQVGDLKRAQSSQYADTQRQAAESLLSSELPTRRQFVSGRARSPQAAQNPVTPPPRRLSPAKPVVHPGADQILGKRKRV